MRVTLMLVASAMLAGLVAGMRCGCALAEIRLVGSVPAARRVEVEDELVICTTTLDVRLLAFLQTNQGVSAHAWYTNLPIPVASNVLERIVGPTTPGPRFTYSNGGRGD